MRCGKGAPEIGSCGGDKDAPETGSYGGDNGETGTNSYDMLLLV